MYQQPTFFSGTAFSCCFICQSQSCQNTFHFYCCPGSWRFRVLLSQCKRKLIVLWSFYFHSQVEKKYYFPMVSLKMAVFLFFSFNVDSNCNSSLLKYCCGKRSVTSIWMYDAWQLFNGKIKKIIISLIVVKTKNKTKDVLSLRCRHHYLKLMVSIIGVALSRLANSQFAICSTSKFNRIAKTSSGSKFWKIPW